MTELHFTRTAATRLPDSEREAILADPGFGDHFTDHMVSIVWTRGEGWHDAEVAPYGPIQMDPASSVLHYGQEIFEGLKAYRRPDGSIVTFRPEENARRLFLVYLARINELADRAEFYNLLSNNCTINIVRYANAAGREGRLDWRHVLNGLIDRYLYATGRIDTTLPFAELRERSDITRAAQAAAGAPDFPDRIRAGLPAIDPRPRVGQ